MALFTLTFYPIKPLKTKKWIVLIASIAFIFISLEGLSLLLKTHEYFHQSYLVLYFLLVVLGISYRQIIQVELNEKNNFFLLFFGIFFGFLWKHSGWQLGVFDYVFYSGLLLSFLLFNIKSQRKNLWIQFVGLVLLMTVIFNNTPARILENQNQYNDRVVFSELTDHHQIDITTWKGNHWFYYNNKVQFSSLDEWLYAEPMVHSIMSILKHKKRVLVIGGENGILIKELLKYQDIEVIDMLILDQKLAKIASGNSLFINLNQGSLINDRVNWILKKEMLKNVQYDAILIDLPDPINHKWNAYYTTEFYEYSHSLLTEDGALITQAGSPYFASKAFLSIEKTLQSANYQTLSLHNQILSLGEWGWILASKSMLANLMKSKSLQFDSLEIETKWLNSESMKMMYSFGKPLLDMDSVLINTIENPVLINYYKKGNYKFK